MQTPASDAVAPGPDGHHRCFWAVGAPEYMGYHDEEWGRPVETDDGFFERLCLEAFQSGLSWLTILRKRPAFRAAFAGFRVAEVARFGPPDIERLMNDAGIVRNRRKIEAAVHNAGRCLEVIDECGSLSALVWRFRPSEPPAPIRSRADWPAVTPRIDRPRRRAAQARLSLCRSDDRLRHDAGRRPGQRPCRGLLRARRGRAPTARGRGEVHRP